MFYVRYRYLLRAGTATTQTGRQSWIAPLMRANSKSPTRHPPGERVASAPKRDGA